MEDIVGVGGLLTVGLFVVVQEMAQARDRVARGVLKCLQALVQVW